MATAAVADDAGFAAREYLTGDWGGTRSRWSEHGVAIEPFLISDAARNTTGGLQVGNAFRALTGVHVHVDTQPTLGYGGGRFMAEYYDFRGDNGTLDRVGDLQFFSNLDASEGGRLAQFHYRHTFGAGGEWIQFGKTDSNNDFDASEHGGLFIHSSAGFSPTILGFPTYPSPASAILGGIERNNWYVHLGIFDGSTQSGIDTGGRGPASFFAFDGAYFSVVEGAWLNGGDALKVGLWSHSAEFDRFDGTVAPRARGAYGLYDFWISRDDAGETARGWAMVAQVGWADKDISEIDLHLSLGLVRYHPIEHRSEEHAIGLYVSYARLSDVPEAEFVDDFELAIELIVRVHLFRWLALSPDLQYIVHPGGRGAANAFVMSLRLEVLF